MKITPLKENLPDLMSVFSNKAQQGSDVGMFGDAFKASVGQYQQSADRQQRVTDNMPVSRRNQDRQASANRRDDARETSDRPSRNDRDSRTERTSQDDALRTRETNNSDEARDFKASNEDASRTEQSGDIDSKEDAPATDKTNESSQAEQPQADGKEDTSAQVKQNSDEVAVSGNQEATATQPLTLESLQNMMVQLEQSAAIDTSINHSTEQVAASSTSQNSQQQSGKVDQSQAVAAQMNQAVATSPEQTQQSGQQQQESKEQKSPQASRVAQTLAQPKGDSPFSEAVKVTPTHEMQTATAGKLPEVNSPVVQPVTANTGDSITLAGRQAQPQSVHHAAAQVNLPSNMNDADQQNVSRVMRAMTATMNQRGGNLTLRLTPPEMGVVRVHMNIQDGTVRAQFATSTNEARHLLQQNLPMLRQSLESHGLTVDRVQIQTMPSQSQSETQNQQQQQQQHMSDGRSQGQYTQQHQRQQQQNDDAQRRAFADRLATQLD